MLKRLYGRNHGKLQPAMWPSVMPCCIQACIYPASTNRSQGRASAFPFSGIRNASSSEKKSMTSQGSAATRAIGAISSPLPSCRVLWLLCLRPCCSHVTKTLAPEAAKSIPGQGLLAHPTLNRQRLLDSCVQGWGLRMSESASIRDLA